MLVLRKQEIETFPVIEARKKIRISFHMKVSRTILKQFQKISVTCKGHLQEAAPPSPLSPFNPGSPLSPFSPLPACDVLDNRKHKPCFLNVNGWLKDKQN